MTKLNRSTAHRATLAASCSLLLASCASVPPAQKPLVTQQRPLSALLKASAYPNSDTLLVLVTMQQLMATHREWEGYQYFGRLSEEQPNRRALFRALQATMQARVANDVPLLRRVSWVEDAIRKLDEGAAAEPVLGRLARGLVFADLPSRFHKASQAIEDLELVPGPSARSSARPGSGIYRGLAAAYRTLGDQRRSQEMLDRAGLASLDDPLDPRVLGDVSVDAARGFRFGGKRLVREAEGVYVAEGYDFANLAFIVADGFVVAIDAGTTEESARDAVAALRRSHASSDQVRHLDPWSLGPRGGPERRARAGRYRDRPCQFPGGAPAVERLSRAVSLVLRDRHDAAGCEAGSPDRGPGDALRGRSRPRPHPGEER